jgi:hypothetical protein
MTRPTVAPTVHRILRRQRGPEAARARDELAKLEDALRGAITTVLLYQQREKERIEP